jgi:hypothetical protein
MEQLRKLIERGRMSIVQLGQLGSPDVAVLVSLFVLLIKLMIVLCGPVRSFQVMVCQVCFVELVEKYTTKHVLRLKASPRH